MAFSYDKLWKKLEEKNMNITDLRKATGMSSATTAKLAKNQNINMASLDKICQVLECRIEEVIEFTPENQSVNQSVNLRDK